MIGLPCFDGPVFVYTVTAGLRGAERSAPVEVPIRPYLDRRRHPSHPDSDAQIAAMVVVCAKAADAPIWELGEITLTSPDGRVVSRSEAKR